MGPRGALVALVLLSCGDDLGEGRPESPDRARPASFYEIPAGSATAGLEAAEVLGVLSVATQATLEQSLFARGHSRDPLVVGFAERVIAGQPHELRALEIALARLGISPADTEASVQFQQRARELMLMLQMQGDDFDTAFIQAQITTRRELLRILDESRICRFSGRTCIGFGGASFIDVDGDDEDDDVRFPEVGRDFDERSLFTFLRSSLLAQLTEVSFLQGLVTAPPGAGAQ